MNMRRWTKGSGCRNRCDVLAVAPVVGGKGAPPRLCICRVKRQNFISQANDLVNQFINNFEKIFIFEAVAESSCWNVVTPGRLSRGRGWESCQGGGVPSDRCCHLRSCQRVLSAEVVFCFFMLSGDHLPGGEARSISSST